MNTIKLLTENKSFPLQNKTIRKTIAKQICIHKIKLLQCIELASAKYETYNAEWTQQIKTTIENNFPQYSYFCSRESKKLQINVGDFCHKLSFKLLLIVFLKTNDFHRLQWFIKNEVKLFVFRYISLSEENKRSFLIQKNICCSSVDLKAKKKFDSDEIFKVNWKDVLKLVAKRKVLILKGYAYIGNSQIPHVIATKKTEILNETIKRSKIYLLATLIDPRICDVVEDLEKYVTKNINNRSWSRLIDEDEINKKPILESSVHFPPCMRNIVNHIEEHNHLKHTGRLQFIPFLKEIGLSVDNAISYFKKQFCKKMPEEEFVRKKYEYFIKHQYGLAGGCIDFNSFDCMKINKYSNPICGDCNGCPFSSRESALEINSLQYLSAKNRGEILDLVDKGLFNQACTKEYSLVHRRSLNKYIENPVEYYAYSINDRKNNNL